MMSLVRRAGSDLRFHLTGRLCSSRSWRGCRKRTTTSSGWWLVVSGSWLIRDLDAVAVQRTGIDLGQVRDRSAILPCLRNAAQRSQLRCVEPGAAIAHEPDHVGAL